MNIYEQLGKARQQFHALKLKKTGLNKFAGYEYFELADFLLPAMKCMQDNNLVAVISFGADIATMTIASTIDDKTIQITSPMSEANMKGNQPVQNLGAVETYQRRYLWVAAMEIVEHDALDSAEPQKPEAKPQGKLATDAQHLLISDYIEAGQVPVRTLEWYKKNKDALTEAKAKDLIAICKEHKA